MLRGTVAAGAALSGSNNGAINDTTVIFGDHVS